MSKSFRITESKSIQVRMDAQNVLNHPNPAAPNLDINNVNFGCNFKRDPHFAGNLDRNIGTLLG